MSESTCGNRDHTDRKRNFLKIDLRGYLLICFGGTLICVFLMGMWLKVHVVDVWGWRKTPCVILSSSAHVPEMGTGRVGEFEFAVKYSYRVGGKEYVGERYSLRKTRWQDYAELQESVGRYSVGEHSFCYYDPGNEGDSFLDRSIPFFHFLLFWVFLAMFVLLCRWMFELARELTGRRGVEDEVGRSSRWICLTQRTVLVFSLIFFLTGSAYFFKVLLEHRINLDSWAKTPCVVVGSEFRISRQARQRPTYRLYILYRYVYDSREYMSNRYYSLLDYDSKNRKKLREIVSAYPPGRKTVCYVNPAKPIEASLRNDPATRMMIYLSPMLFIIVGALGMAFSRRIARRMVMRFNNPEKRVR